MQYQMLLQDLIGLLDLRQGLINETMWIYNT